MTRFTQRERPRTPYRNYAAAVLSLLNLDTLAQLQLARELVSEIHEYSSFTDFKLTPQGDSICLILGTYAPMVLRQTQSRQFCVVGECYVHGLSDAVGILGPLPDNWIAIIRGDALGRPTPRYTSLENQHETKDDPRLGPLPANWERATSVRSAEDPSIFDRFCNLVTGELVDSDPRLFPDVLEARGVELKCFTLI
jgi:hypothetical protein